MILISITDLLANNMLRTAGVAGVVIVALFYVYKTTIGRRFFATLTQKRKVVYLTILPMLIAGTGITSIILSYKQNISQALIGNKHFFYQGQIINEKGIPVAKAYAFIILGTDTIKSLAPTGNDGNFTIELDTVEGIKTTVYYGHPDYENNSVFRALSASTFEQMVLKNKSRDLQKRQVTFSVNIEDSNFITALEQKAGLKYSAIDPIYNIVFLYDKSAIDSFDNRFRYLGGKVRVYIDGKLCCESTQSLNSTHAAGTNRPTLEKELMKMVRSVVNDEKNALLTRIAGCLGK